jgi:hypothetical protein
MWWRASGRARVEFKNLQPGMPRRSRQGSLDGAECTQNVGAAGANSKALHHVRWADPASTMEADNLLG